MTLTIVPTPSDAKVTINGEERSSLTAERGTEAAWEVSAEGYVTQGGTLTLEEDTELPVTLDEEVSRDPVDGVYVAYVDANGVNRICATADWDDGLGEAQGVLVGDGSHEVLVAPTIGAGMPWASDTVLIEGVTDARTADAARDDYEGKANTAACVAAGIGESYAPGWCNAYSHGQIGAGEWWLPACGELYNLIWLHLSDINEALTAIGGDTLAVKIWSSTQFDNDAAWFVNLFSGGMTGGDVKDEGDDCGRVCAVSSFDFEEETDGGAEPASLSASRKSRRSSKTASSKASE